MVGLRNWKFYFQIKNQIKYSVHIKIKCIGKYSKKISLKHSCSSQSQKCYLFKCLSYLSKFFSATQLVTHMWEGFFVSWRWQKKNKENPEKSQIMPLDSFVSFTFSLNCFAVVSFVQARTDQLVHRHKGGLILKIIFNLIPSSKN